MNLALVGTFHQRHENTLPLLRRVLCESARVPDETWLLCEGQDDMDCVLAAITKLNVDATDLNVVLLPTPRVDGRYRVIPYAQKINWALGRTKADAVCYLDNNSMPSRKKYEAMAEGLEEHPCVYVSQERTGFDPLVFTADRVIECGSYQLNYTQIAHRRTVDRWPLDMRYANPDVADAIFMVQLAKSLGPARPVGGPEIHDLHHIPSPVAAGLE